MAVLTDDFVHLERLVGRLLDAIADPLGDNGERLLDEAREANNDALAALVATVEYLADAPGATSSEDELHEPLLRSNEGFTFENRSWFHVACARGSVDTVTALVDQCGLDPTEAECDLNAQTPLHVAAARGHPEIVVYLLKCGVDLAKRDVDGRKPLECAEFHGQDRAARLIKFWEPSLSLDEGHEEEKSCDPPPPDEDVRIEAADFEDVAITVVRGDKKMSASDVPILEEEFAHLEGLVTRLFDVIGERSAYQTGRSRCTLTEAEREALVKEAWEAAEDVDALAPLIVAVEFLAQSASSDELHGPLLRCNTGVTYKNRSWFHVACARGDLDATTALVKQCGLDPKQTEPDDNEETPLHTAAVWGHLDVVALLLFECGLDQTLRDSIGRTPRECAAKQGHTKVVRLFESFTSSSFHVASTNKGGAAGDDAPTTNDPRLPATTLIKDRHEERDDTNRWITDYLGSGTFGDVYATYHPHAQQNEAVMVVRLDGKPLGDAKRIERLRSQLDEAEIMLGLHPNLVASRPVLLPRDNPYLFTAYIEGGVTLSRCIKELDMELDTKIRLALVLAHGLEHIRRCFPNRDYTHWDLKPGNILVDCRRDDDGNPIHQTQYQCSWGMAFLAMLIGECPWDNSIGEGRV